MSILVATRRESVTALSPAGRKIGAEIRTARPSSCELLGSSGPNPRKRLGGLHEHCTTSHRQGPEDSLMWAKFDDRYPWNRKVRPLSDAAFRLDVSAVCWSSEYLTDGVISPDDLPQVSDVKRPQLAAAELVRRGRWHASGHDCPDCPDVPPGGHVVHHFLDYNPPREKVEADREKRRQAGQMGGKASGRSRANAKQSASDLLNKSEAQVASSPTNTRTRTRSPSGYVGGEVTEDRKSVV